MLRRHIPESEQVVPKQGEALAQIKQRSAGISSALLKREPPPKHQTPELDFARHVQGAAAGIRLCLRLTWEYEQLGTEWFEEALRRNYLWFETPVAEFSERQNVERGGGGVLASVRTTTQWNGRCLLRRPDSD